MTLTRMVLDASRLRELLHYAPDTGVFTWLVGQSWRRAVGSRAGYSNSTRGSQPYRGIMIDYRNYRENRLAWLYMTGEWPSCEVDHRNCDPLDNRWSNLRLASSTQNKANARKRVDNKTGFKGVHRCGKRFYARARLNGKYQHLGMFDTAEQASARYRAVTVAAHGGFAR